MRTRLFSSIAGGLLGAVVTYPINGSLGLTPAIALVACSSAGVAVGYVASVLYDVFATSAGDEN